MKYILLISHVIFFANTLFSNNHRQDSLESVWQDDTQSLDTRFKAINEQYNVNRDSSNINLVLTKYHLELAEKSNNIEEKISAIHSRSKIYYFTGDLENAYSAAKEELAFVKTQEIPTKIVQAYCLKGAIEIEQREFSNALKSFISAQKICIENDLKRPEITVNNNIAIVYHSIGSYEKAIEYLTKSENISVEEGFDNVLGSVWLNFGSNYLELKKIKLAKSYFEKSLDFFRKKDNLFSQGSCLHMLANCNLELGNLDIALNQILETIPIDSLYGNELRILENQLLYSEILLELDNPKAFTIANEITQFINEETPTDIMSDYYHLMYLIFTKQNNYKQALEMNLKYSEVQDEIRQDEIDYATIRQVLSHEFEIQAFQDKLAAEKKQSDIRLSAVKRNYLILLVSALIISIVIILFIIKTNKSKQEKERLLKEINELKRKSEAIVFNEEKQVLNREQIEQHINRSLNTTDWSVLNILLEDPMITNGAIAEKIYLSPEGVSSSLRRMYQYFEIKKTKYKKIALITTALKISKTE